MWKGYDVPRFKQLDHEKVPENIRGFMGTLFSKHHKDELTYRVSVNGSINHQVNYRFPELHPNLHHHLKKRCSLQGVKDERELEHIQFFAQEVSEGLQVLRTKISEQRDYLESILGIHRTIPSLYEKPTPTYFPLGGFERAE